MFQKIKYYQVPEPGMPIAWIAVTINWKKKTKKNTMKLKELSFLKEKKLFNNYTNFEILMFSQYILESFVCWSKPA